MNEIKEVITYKYVTRKIACIGDTFEDYKKEMANQKGDESRVILDLIYTPFEQSLTIKERIKIITLTSNT